MTGDLLQFHREQIDPYRGVGYIFNEHEGHIVWRRGTGGNVELLHIRTHTKGHGVGRKLVSKMLDRLKDSLPYYSVFGFTRVSNEEAKAFYGALGFELQEVAGVYADGRAILFWQEYGKLCESVTKCQGSAAV